MPRIETDTKQEADQQQDPALDDPQLLEEFDVLAIEPGSERSPD